MRENQAFGGSALIRVRQGHFPGAALALRREYTPMFFQRAIAPLDSAHLRFRVNVFSSGKSE